MNNDNCFKNRLKYIYCLQEINLNNNYNTRVITLYDKYNKLFKFNFNYEGNKYDTTFLKIEKIYDYYVVFSLIGFINNNYINTHNYISININCICAIKCFKDIKLL